MLVVLKIVHCVLSGVLVGSYIVVSKFHRDTFFSLWKVYLLVCKNTRATLLDGLDLTQDNSYMAWIWLGSLGCLGSVEKWRIP
jgi:hypothetical protein